MRSSSRTQLTSEANCDASKDSLFSSSPPVASAEPIQIRADAEVYGSASGYGYTAIPVLSIVASEEYDRWDDAQS